MERPIISIIIPVYNAKHHIIETLESIENQSFEDWECLLIDDHSTDGTFEALNKFTLQDARFKYYKRPSSYKPGGCGARNYGFDLSKGSYVQWFDADDLMDANMLKVKLSKFSHELDAVICQTVTFKGEVSNILGTATRIESKKPFIDFFNGDITYYTPGPLWKKSFLLNLGFLFNTALLNVQEWEFYAKILLKSPSIKTINSPFIYYRKHENSIWGKKRTKKKIMSEFNAAKSVFNLGISFKKEIIKSYFLRLGKLYFELLEMKNNYKERKEIKKELIKIFFQKRVNFKDSVRFVNYLFIKI